jgi:hypothetical protein
MGIKLPIFSPYGSYRLSWWGESIYTLYFPFFAFRSPFPLSALFSSIKSNPQQYRVYYNISNYFARKFIFKNFWISVFFYLIICMNSFTFIYLLFFPGFTGSTTSLTWKTSSRTLGVFVLILNNLDTTPGFHF